MDKYKVRSTIYGVFLLVTLVIAGILLFLLVSNDKKEDNETLSKSDAIKIVEEVYNKAYIYASNNMFSRIEDISSITSEYLYCSYYKLDTDSLNNYFSETAINNIKSRLILLNDNYYDCYNNTGSILDNTLLKNYNTNFDIVVYTEDYIVVKVSFDNNKTNILTLTKVNDNWLIDDYE